MLDAARSVTVKPPPDSGSAAHGNSPAWQSPRPTTCADVNVSEKTPQMDVDLASADVWRDHLEAQGIAAGIVVLDMPPAIGGRHAYLIGFDALRDQPGRTHLLLAHAEQLWSQLGTAPQLEFTRAGGRASLLDEDDSRLRLGAAQYTGLHGILDHLGSSLVLQSHIRGVTLRAVFFCAACVRKPPERRQVSDILPLLVEHGLARASLLRQSRQAALLEAMFNRVSLAMLLLDANCRPIFANSAAEHLLEERTWLLRYSHGIGCVGAVASRELRAAVRQVATGQGMVEDKYVRIDSPTGDWRLLQVASPVKRPGVDTTRSAMVIVLSPSRVVASQPLLEALGLIPSEQRFLRRFLASSNIGDAAGNCGISEETARTYLKRVRSKLGVSRQMELASLISSLASPMGGREEAVTV